MKKLTAVMKQMLDALAHAHAGEHLSPRGKAMALGQQDTVAVNQIVEQDAETSRATSKTNVRRVALYLGSELHPEVMEYVIATCSRLCHGLTVLTFQSKSDGRALMDPYEQALAAAGVEMEMVVLSGDPISGLGRYLRRHPEIAFLACRETGYLGRSYLKGTQRKNLLPVPVVVVATSAEGAKKLDQAATVSETDTDTDTKAIVA